MKFVVRGLPVPQGSTRAFTFRGKDGRPGARVTHTNEAKLADWRAMVHHEAQLVAPKAPWEGPVAVQLEFRMPRPDSVPTHRGRGKKRVRVHALPHRRPDLDKLCRALLDGLTNVIFKDDAQVVWLFAKKVYGAPAVTVSVEEL